MTFDPVVAIETALANKTQRERDEEAAYQARCRAALKLPTALDVRAQIGAQMVEIAQQVLALGEDDFEYTRLAEGYAMQGDYRKAAALTKDVGRQQYYEAVIAAVDNPFECGCPRKRGALSNIFTKDRILFDGQARELLACAVCGHLTC